MYQELVVPQRTAMSATSEESVASQKTAMLGLQKTLKGWVRWMSSPGRDYPEKTEKQCP
uniref:Uncharacterized protein n=1 Tax=Candidozyma auris TaxID=498019 RepID=A0A0L0P326_CANAR